MIQLKRIIILIDGDGAIFNFELIERGIKGGREAGLQLAKGVHQYLNGQEGRQMWAYVFLSRQKLAKTFRRSSKPTAADTLSDFMVGFNQAADRFMMVDVGGEKEAADAKIKGLRHRNHDLSITSSSSPHSTHGS